MTLPSAILDAVLAHARAELPNEACGLIAGTAPAADGGLPTIWHPTRNAAASPVRYEVDPDDLVRISLALDDAGEVLWGIVHSHVRSPARPSPTDVARAFYPDAIHLIVSLDGGRGGAGADIGDGCSDGAAGSVSDPERVRAWRIENGAVSEVKLAIGC